MYQVMETFARQMVAWAGTIEAMFNNNDSFYESQELTYKQMTF